LSFVYRKYFLGIQNVAECKKMFFDLFESAYLKLGISDVIDPVRYFSEEIATAYFVQQEAARHQCFSSIFQLVKLFSSRFKKHVMLHMKSN